MKIIRSLSLKNKTNKIIHKLKFIYDISKEKQSVQIIDYRLGKLNKRITRKKYTIQEIEQLILDKIKQGFQVYTTNKEKSLSFKQFEKEIKYLFKNSQSPKLKDNSKTQKKKKRRSAIFYLENIINSYDKKDLLNDIKKHNSKKNLKIASSI